MKERNAHSLVEMLVVLIVVAAMMAIIVPAVQRSRESARKTQCTNHQADLAKAVHLHVAGDSFGRYPGYRANTADDSGVIGWAAQVFNHLGRNDIDPTQGTYIEVLTCPSDAGPRTGARLNYVVNGGQAGSDSRADGIFFDHTTSLENRVYITNDDFRDGLRNTIMLAENLDATEWTDTDEDNQCILWPLTSGNEVNRGEGPRPSSHHPGGFIATFADGSTKFLTDERFNDGDDPYGDDSMYVVMLTPGGLDEYPQTVDGVDPCDQPDAGGEVNIGLDWIAA
ncbi:MAG: DUF1559 domain-containing protein, partial [Pirellulales bacterium]|nr:DUF1559 domain-containing protein [Pirellulales bacterium]